MTTTTTSQKTNKKKSKTVKPTYDLPVFDLEKLLQHIQNCVDKAPFGILTLIIDLFCGAGGFSEGAVKAVDKYGNKCAVIIAGVNHDRKAIYSEAVNHPLAYYSSEDVRHTHLEPIKLLVDICRERWPQCSIIIQAGIDCTSHSGAKGGQSRDADSRSLAEFMPRYLEVLQPDGLWIENVKEFLDWGPLHVKHCMQKGTEIKKKVATITLQDPLPEDQWFSYYTARIAEGYICYCPVEKIKRKGGDVKLYSFDAKRKLLDHICIRQINIPIKRLKATFFKPWRQNIEETFGMHSAHKILNAADYGVPQNRKRLFLYFMKHGMPIAHPEPTHSKNADKAGFSKKLPHVPVRTCIDFEIEGRSILDPLYIRSEQTKRRVYNGLIKFVAGGKKNFMMQRNAGIVSRVFSIDSPARCVTTTGGNQEIITAEFLMQSHGGDPMSKVYSMDEACRTVKAGDNQSKVTVQFLFKYRGKNYKNETDSGFKDLDGVSPVIATNNQLACGIIEFINDTETTDTTEKGARMLKFLLHYQGESNAASIDDVSPTVMPGHKLAPVWLYDVKYFLTRFYSSGPPAGDIDKPAGTVLNNPKEQLIAVTPWVMPDQYANIGKSVNEVYDTITADRHYPYLINPQWGEHCAADINKPCFTIIARMDKTAPYLVVTEAGHVMIPVFVGDSETTILIKEFMAMYRISDIKMRMLLIKELKKIQSFPGDYYLAGSQGDQKKFIGNAVACLQAKANVEAMHAALFEYTLKALNIAA